MKNPIALILTDTHLKPDNISLVENIFDQAIAKCKELKIDTILHGGDWFNSRTGQPLSVLKATQRIIDKFKDNYISFTIMAGNHDRTDYDSEESFLDIFYDDPYFHVAEDGEYIDIYEDDKNEENDIYVHFLPFFKESGSYVERLNKIETLVGKNILLTHVAINGANNNDGSMVSDCIPSSAFEKFDAVLVGHYHNRQQFDNIYYIGSAYQSNFGEDDQKGFTILYNDGSIEFIQSHFPLYIKYEINVEQLTSKEILHLQQEKQSGNNIRIKIKGDQAKVKSFDTSLLTQAGISFDLSHNTVDKPLSDEEMSKNITHDKKSIVDAFKSFCSDNKITDNKYGLEKLKEI